MVLVGVVYVVVVVVDSSVVDAVADCAGVGVGADDVVVVGGPFDVVAVVALAGSRAVVDAVVLAKTERGFLPAEADEVVRMVLSKRNTVWRHCGCLLIVDNRRICNDNRAG